MKIDVSFNPGAEDVDFLTAKLNEEAKSLGVKEEAYPFALFIRSDEGQIIAGCNGSVVYGAIYTDQLWVDGSLRGQGIGRMLMDKVHALGLSKGCTLATVCTMSFQGARKFYEHLGYTCDFERPGYVEGSSLFFLRKKIED